MRNIFTGALVGGLLTAPLIALLSLGNQLFGLPFVPYSVFNWVSRVLPGSVITFGIDLMIDSMLLLGINVADTAKLAEQAMALILFLVYGIFAGAICFYLLSRRASRIGILDGIVIGLLFGLPAISVSVGFENGTLLPFWSGLWLTVLFLAWGLLISWSYRRLHPPTQETKDLEGQEGEVKVLNRRQFLVSMGGVAAVITVAGAGLSSVLASEEKRRRELALEGTMAHKTQDEGGKSFPNSDDPVTPAPGTRPEYTPLKDHYKVFIELEPTVIDGTDYKLPVTGLVENPLMLTLDELRQNFQSRDQYVTISCISGRVGTSLIGTTLWTGVSLQAILNAAKPQEEARYLQVASGDGFHESVDLDLIASDERIMLCYAWDGNPLPNDHGFPLRIWLPDRFGMKQPKWITAFELTDQYKEGYWVERGWDEIAQVKTTSVIDTVAIDAADEINGELLVPVGGIAFQGIAVFPEWR